MTSIADPDYWSLLGLAPDSDQDQLKRAFRREAADGIPISTGTTLSLKSASSWSMRPTPS